MKNMLEQFEELAREWLDFNKKYGEDKSYCRYGDFVECYAADIGYRRDVTFGEDDCKITVSFYDNVEFECITYETLANWESMVAKGRLILEAEKEKHRNKTPEQVRRAEVRRLRKRLEELGEV